MFYSLCNCTKNEILHFFYILYIVIFLFIITLKFARLLQIRTSIDHYRQVIYLMAKLLQDFGQQVTYQCSFWRQQPESWLEGPYDYKVKNHQPFYSDHCANLVKKRFAQVLQQRFYLSSSSVIQICPYHIIHIYTSSIGTFMFLSMQKEIQYQCPHLKLIP